MARSTRKTSKARKKTPAKAVRLRDRPRLLWRGIVKYVFRGILVMIALAVLATVAFSAMNPPTTPYMFSEGRRVGGVNQTWVAMEEIAPVMARSAVAAEDANFCLHWGLDLTAIQAALEDGSNRGGSTISQQVVKNVYLWHGRSWFRKSLEALMTPLVEAVWSKERILEVYLNVAEFDEGVFGVEAAAVHYFGVRAADLSPTQAARLAAILPNPKNRSASQPSSFVRGRAASIRDGAATIGADGRADCFE
ncbi:monofunctional biosynthetic peptidoglycan transglycosylase [Octadecabacter sp. G9-8]|uniref:Biosynthetic peptidoglycan transglycosylase n=1 Tax=Octadecabacter dasysiphoniae TaxID=2909341 RepID=A0ABS9CX36_9RHOB|nr:monofunctional biosynthetic peptidoglycan transglycosylase [Octadecabacter dasysiphoniae]MCF2871404.1 monofunctional biosynthetic peptidoglycan transglycosylase [Octadecabacter dasysiphoniae]